MILTDIVDHLSYSYFLLNSDYYLVLLVMKFFYIIVKVNFCHSF